MLLSVLFANDVGLASVGVEKFHEVFDKLQKILEDHELTVTELARHNEQRKSYSGRHQLLNMSCLDNQQG